MKAADYIARLEEGELIGFSEKEKQEAVSLAKIHTGRVVLEEWKAWRLKNDNSFTAFAVELYQILKSKELKDNSLQTSECQKFDTREIKGNVADKKETPRRENPQRELLPGKNPFDQVKNVFRNIKKENPKAGNDFWVYDENIGWTVDGFPVF